jgi:hypothetical protein
MARKKNPKPVDSERVEEVARLRLDGLQVGDLITYGQEQGWNLDESQASELVDRADELIYRRRDKKRPRAIALQIAQRKALYARSVNAGDHATAARILDSIAKLQGLYDQHKDRADLLRLIVAQQAKIQQLQARLNVKAIEVEAKRQ